jgi:hypothetical protein
MEGNMKKILVILITVLGPFLFNCEEPVKPIAVSSLIKNIQWLKSRSTYGSPCIRIMDEKVIYDVLVTRLPDENWHIRVVAAGEKCRAAGIEITAVHAYNTNENAPHTKQSGFVGFVFDYRGEEAVQAMEAIKPQHMIPAHWLETEKSDIDYIKENRPDTTEVVCLSPVTRNVKMNKNT